ncbi:argininosuccinate synthase [Allomyces macrogynus ATCC 38327]|uniref:Argininosuccinate synthase n=1 Tax=Allomyces macrogynus (strain ATCC 38327) TaxID=578462 RepID=A0A0L0SBY1_ALLM3|nr:argininosuccinate synthase [Allomyces macrogynus ATCC 38327]|eukprot:KNE59971.1 argininosuccinate synthase [Allomyces macrogynus ATCC 38327]
MSPKRKSSSKRPSAPATPKSASPAPAAAPAPATAAAPKSAASKGRVCLAYSGGLDTSCILAWLIDEGYEVVAFMADVGQEEDFEAARQKALLVGAKSVHIHDLREQFVEKIIWPCIQSNATYENDYLLGTSLARPVITAAQIAVAKAEGCDFVSHGCTGKGNDQVRFELGYYALQPSIKVISPWRIPAFYERFAGRQALLDYAAQKGIPVAQTKAKPWSTDENLYHISFEAGILEDPDVTPPADMWKLTVDPATAPAQGESIAIDFVNGIPVSVENLSDKTVVGSADKPAPLDVFLYLNTLGRRNGIGRIDIVENRFIGIKSRGCYETPGGTILLKAHKDLEGLTMDREVRKLRDELSFKYAHLLYNGLYFTPETKMILDMVKASQTNVSGRVRLSLRQGNVTILGRKALEPKKCLYNSELASMDSSLSDAGSGWGFDPTASEGFIKTISMRIRLWSAQQEQPPTL